MPQAAGKHHSRGYAFVKAQREKIAEEKRRGQTHRKLYGKAAYQQFREGLLRSKPLCEDCRIARSEHVHHVRKLALHPEDLCDADHCKALCETCHDIRTGKGE